MKDILVKKAIEILEELKSIDYKYSNREEWRKEHEEKIEVLKTGDEKKIKELFRSFLGCFEKDLQGGWDCCGIELEHFDDTALEVIARLYLDEPIVYKKRIL